MEENNNSFNFRKRKFNCSNKDNKDNKDDKDDKDNKTNNQVAKRMLKFAMNSATAHNKNLEKKKVKK